MYHDDYWTFWMPTLMIDIQLFLWGSPVRNIPLILQGADLTQPEGKVGILFGG
jgi:hypothetical protein